MELEIKGIDGSIANALRRIIISEIPTMAIEKVDMYMNTSVIPDEILAHRLGLVPLQADPRLFQEKQEDEDYSPTNTIKMRLDVKCERKQQYKHTKWEELQHLAPEDYLHHCNVYASDFQWVPLGGQESTFNFSQLGPIHPNILLAKLRENQQIELEVYCEKNIGKVHAKWQAVSPAYYRLMPEVRLLKDINDLEDMQTMVDKCPMRVFEIEEKKKNKRLVVKRPRDCTMCRECIRDDNHNHIYLGKVQDHYIFTIEAVGMLSPQDIFIQAIQILRSKIDSYLTNFTENTYI